MQKFKRNSKRILCALLTLVMALTLLPVVSLTAEASAGHTLDLSNPPADGEDGVWSVSGHSITYTGTGPLTIEGQNSPVHPVTISVSHASHVILERLYVLPW